MTKQTIYEQHDKTFSNVSAYVLTNDKGYRIGTLAFKFPKDGAGRLYCYLHIIGLEMVRGYAGGYGYDKRSASVVDAVRAIKPCDSEYVGEDRRIELNNLRESLQLAFNNIGGEDWKNIFRNLNIEVLQAV